MKFNKKVKLQQVEAIQLSDLLCRHLNAAMGSWLVEDCETKEQSIMSDKEFQEVYEAVSLPDGGVPKYDWVQIPSVFKT